MSIEPSLKRTSLLNAEALQFAINMYKKKFHKRTLYVLEIMLNDDLS
jgi:hypothetical protein